MSGNTPVSIEAGSPLWLGQFLDKISSRVAFVLFEWCRSGFFLRVLAALTGALFLLPSVPGLLANRDAFYHSFGQFTYFAFSLHGLGVLLLLTSLAFSWRAKILFYAPLTIGVTLALAFAMNFFYFRTSFFLEVGVCYAVLGASVWLLCGPSRAWSWRARLSLFVALLIFAFFAFTFLYQRNAQVYPSTGFVFQILLFVAPFWVAQACGIAPSTRAGSALSFAFSPVQYFCPALPIPPHMLRQGSGREAAGVLNILGGTALLCLLALEYRLNGFTLPELPFVTFLLHGWGTYLRFYVGFLGTAHIAVGIGRWLGADLVNPARHALLAADPLDRWRRWNYYFYWFYLTFVWLPISRRTGSLVLATFTVFTLNCIWHNNWLAQLLHGYEGAEVFALARSQLFFYLGHAVLLCASFHLQRFLPSEARRVGWVGVGACHLVMAILYGIL